MTKLPTKAILSLMAALFFCMGIHAQNIGDLKIEKKSKPRWGNYALTAGLALLSGGSDGMRDAVLFHNDRVMSRLNTKSSFWSPESWRRKYKNGDPQQGPKFPGSTGPLVFITDAPHFFKFSQNLFTAGAIAVQFGEERQRWWVYVIKGIAYWAVQRVGFSLVYYRF